MFDNFDSFVWFLGFVLLFAEISGFCWHLCFFVFVSLFCRISLRNCGVAVFLWFWDGSGDFWDLGTDLVIFVLLGSMAGPSPAGPGVHSGSVHNGSGRSRKRVHGGSVHSWSVHAEVTKITKYRKWPPYGHANKLKETIFLNSPPQLHRKALRIIISWICPMKPLRV